MRMRKKLKKLREAADAACKKAADMPHRFDEAINWADLGCYAAYRVMPEEGRPFYQVWIAEADPVCPRFQAWVREQLRQAGFDEVEVLTEW